MTGPRIVFVDTETTSLGSMARPWEIALIVRDDVEPAPAAVPEKMTVDPVAEAEYVFHVEYFTDSLPAGTTHEALEVGGWYDRGRTRQHADWLATAYPPEVGIARDAEWSIARTVYQLLAGVVLVGVGVHFDAAVLSAMFRRHGLPEEPWQYAIVDLKAATWGVFAVRAAVGVAEQHEATASALPMRSEELAAALGAQPPTDEERHTALGDARWARRWFDQLTGRDQGTP